MRCATFFADEGPFLASGLAFDLLLCVMCFLYVLYRLSPTARRPAGALALRAFAGAILFEFSRWTFTFYVAIAEQLATFYGTLGGLLFFLLWMYYACAVFIFGAEVAAASNRQ